MYPSPYQDSSVPGSKHYFNVGTYIQLVLMYLAENRPKLNFIGYLTFKKLPNLIILAFT